MSLAQHVVKKNIGQVPMPPKGSQETSGVCRDTFRASRSGQKHTSKHQQGLGESFGTKSLIILPFLVVCSHEMLVSPLPGTLKKFSDPVCLIFFLTPPCSFISMSNILEINCLVLGDNLSRLFTVEVPVGKNISALKVSILGANQHTFGHVDAKDLDIFQVSFPSNDVDTEFKRFHTEEDFKNASNRLSNPTTLVENVFEAPINKDYLHVVVLPPPDGKCYCMWDAGALTE
jgi:hypothetical protein